MRRILNWIAFTFVLLTIPQVARATSCPPSHTFSTGETLTQAILNSNPVTFSSCFGNIDNTNIGSAGLYASQIKPTNSAQSTFGGGSLGYTFQGGLTTLGTMNATVGANTAFSTNANDGRSVLLFPSNSASNETSLGVNTASSYPYFSLANLSSSGVFQNWLLGIDSGFNLQVPGGSIVTPNNLVFGSGGTGGTLYGVTGGGHNSGDIAHSGNLSTGGSIVVTGGITTHGFINNGAATVTGALGVGSLSSSGNVAITGGTTTNGFVNTGPATITGSLDVAGVSDTAGISTTSTMTGTTGGTFSQVMPTLVRGSAVTSQANAHTEVVDITLGGLSGIRTDVFNFTKPFDGVPVCHGLVKVASAPSIQAYMPSITSTQYTITGDSGGHYQSGCTGV